MAWIARPAECSCTSARKEEYRKQREQIRHQEYEEWAAMKIKREKKKKKKGHRFDPQALHRYEALSKDASRRRMVVDRIRKSK